MVWAGSTDNLQLVEQKLPSGFELLTRAPSIYTMFQDSRGLVWILSTQGLIQYDGYEFKFFRHDKNNPQSIANSLALRICEDSKGKLWFGLISGGLSCYNPFTNTFKNYSTKSIMAESNDVVHSLFVDSNDEIWFNIGQKGLSHLNKENGTFETFPVVTADRCPNTKPDKIPLHNFLMDIEARDDDNLWLGTPEGLFSFNKKTKEITVMRPKYSKNLHHDVYNAGIINKVGSNIWIGGWGSGIQCYDTLTGAWTDYSLLLPGEISSVSNLITGMVKKDDDEFWIASGDKGLTTFNIKTRSFHYLKNDSAYSYLPKIGAHLVFTDNQNNLYAIFYDKIFFFRQKPNLFREYKVPSYPQKNSGLPSVNDIFLERSNRFLYAGTSWSDGIIIYDRGTNTSKTATLYLDNKKLEIQDPLQFLERDSTSVWLLTYDRLYIYYYLTGKVVLPPQPPLLNPQRSNNAYMCMEKEGNDILWLGTNYNGAIRYNIMSGQVQSFGKNDQDTGQIATKYVHLLHIDRKNYLWYGNSRSSILARYDIRSGKSTFYDKDGNTCIRSKSVSTYSLYSDSNYVFACTNSGLMIFDISSNDAKLVRKVDSENGFTSDHIYMIAKENDSIFWMNTVYGIVKYNLNNSHYEIIDNDDGLKSKIIHSLNLNKGYIIIGGPGAFYEYLPHIKKAETKAIAPVLTSFKINGAGINFNLPLSLGKKIIIEPGYKYFTVSYASLDYANTSEIRYSYMLEGFHRSWIDAGDIRNTTFSNLSGGNYMLKLRSTIDNGISFSDVTLIPVHIETIYYETWWFKLLTGMFIGSIILLFYRYRAAKERAIMELNNRAQLLEKEKSVVQYENLRQQLNPHFLFNSLTSLSSLISTQPKIAQQFVDRMSKIYRYILKSNESEIVSLVNELNFADTYVKLQQTRFSSGFEVNINVSEEFHHRKIVPVTIQNLVENAIKHNIIEEESPLVIDVYVEDDYLVVKNNLQKKAIVETSNKHGLNQMKSLYKYLSDKSILVNETEKFFEIKIPLI